MIDMSDSVGGHERDVTAIPGDRNQPADPPESLVWAYRSALVDERTWALRPDSIEYHQAVARVWQWMFTFDQLGWPREALTW